MAVANERVVNGIKTRVLHNKDYVEVAERLRIVHAIEQAEEKPFEMVESAPFEIAGRIVWRVVIKFNDKLFIGNAEAKMDAPKNSPDGTNPFECAETSAMGRALAFAGLGTLDSIASYEEVARAKPFVAIVEHPQKAIVEAQKQPQLQALVNTPSTPENTLKSRLNAIYDKAVALNELAPRSTQQIFFAWAGDIIGATVSAVGHFTESRLDAIEKYLDSKEQ